MLNKSTLSIDHLKKAIYQLNLAEHLLEVTYPLVKDPKMLLSILSNLEATHKNLFETVLPSNFNETNISFISKLDKFEDLLQPQIVLNDGLLKTIKTVHDLVEEHENSAVVFSRKDAFIVCKDDYEMIKIDPLLIGEQLHNTKRLTRQIIDMVK